MANVRLLPKHLEPVSAPRRNSVYYYSHFIGPIQIHHEVGGWIQEYRNMKAVATRSNTTKVAKRPWDVYFRDSEIQQDDIAFIIATNMLRLYMDGDFEHSNKLREIAAKGGQPWLNQKCSRLMAYQLSFDWDDRPGMSQEERDARVDLENESSRDRPSTAALASAASMPTEPKSSPRLKRKASESANTPESPKKVIRIKLSHKKQEVQKVKIILKRGSTVKQSGPASSKQVQLDCDWSSMYGSDPEKETEPFPDFVEPTEEEMQAWVDDVAIAATSDNLEGFNAIPSKPAPEEIINFKPKMQKPSFRFEPSSIASRLPNFLAEMKAANEQLAAGHPNQHSMEIPDSDTTSEHIEMDLGLGVLEELRTEPEPLLKLRQS